MGLWSRCDEVCAEMTAVSRDLRSSALTIAKIKNRCSVATTPSTAVVVVLPRGREQLLGSSAAGAGLRGEENDHMVLNRGIDRIGDGEEKRTSVSGGGGNGDGGDDGGGRGADKQEGDKSGKRSRRGRKMVRDGNEFRHHLTWCRHVNGHCKHLEEGGYCMYAHTFDEWRTANLNEMRARLISLPLQWRVTMIFVLLCLLYSTTASYGRRTGG